MKQTELPKCRYWENDGNPSCRKWWLSLYLDGLVFCEKYVIISFYEKEIISTKFCKQVHCQSKMSLTNVERVQLLLLNRMSYEG